MRKTPYRFFALVWDILKAIAGAGPLVAPTASAGPARRPSPYEIAEKAKGNTRREERGHGYARTIDNTLRRGRPSYAHLSPSEQVAFDHHYGTVNGQDVEKQRRLPPW